MEGESRGENSYPETQEITQHFIAMRDILFTNIQTFFRDHSPIECYADLSFGEVPKVYGYNINNCLELCAECNDQSPTLVCLQYLYRSNELYMPEDCIYLAKLLRQFGFYNESIAICNDVIANKRSIDKNIFDAQMQKAKGYRGLGKYDKAQEIYRKQLAESIKNKHLLNEAYVLMMMGKLSENYSWRTGQYKQLILFAIKRIKKYLKTLCNTDQKKQANYYLAICYDSLAQVLHDEKCKLVDHENSINYIKKIESNLDKASYHFKISENTSSIFRNKFRKYFILFKLFPEKQKYYLQLYKRRFGEFTDGKKDYRGIAVRYGQLGEMLTTTGEYDEALDSLQYSISLAKMMSDWRTFSKSNLRLAELYSQIDKEKNWDKIINSLTRAQMGIGRIGGSQPEIGIDILREYAIAYTQNGEYNKAILKLESAIAILRELEKRLGEEHTQFSKSEKDFCVAERQALTSGEWIQLREALLIDARIFSAYLDKITKDLKPISEIQSRHSNVDMQLGLLYKQNSIWKHRIGRVKSTTFDQIKSILSKRISDTNISQTVYLIDEMSREIDEWVYDINNALTRINGDGIMEWISVRQILHDIQYLGMELKTDSDLSIVLDEKENYIYNDFCIMANRGYFKQILITLVENAARVLFTSKSQQSRRIILRCYLGDNEEVANANKVKRECGIIEIEDNAGLLKQLQMAFDKPQKEGSGILLVKDCLTFYKAEYNIIGEEGSFSCIRIIIPHHDRIKLASEGNCK